MRAQAIVQSLLWRESWNMPEKFGGQGQQDEVGFRRRHVLRPVSSLLRGFGLDVEICCRRFGAWSLEVTDGPAMGNAMPRRCGDSCSS